MFNWLRRRGIERRRMIYKFWDGARYRKVDPVDIHLKLQAHKTYNAERHLRMIDEGDNEATRITCGAVQDVFGVSPYDPEKKRGLTVGEQLGLLADFYFWIEDQKKSIRHSWTQPPSTESATLPGSNATITDATAGCTSPASAPTCDMPTGSDTQSMQH